MYTTKIFLIVSASYHQSGPYDEEVVEEKFAREVENAIKTRGGRISNCSVNGDDPSKFFCQIRVWVKLDPCGHNRSEDACQHLRTLKAPIREALVAYDDVKVVLKIVTEEVLG